MALQLRAMLRTPAVSSSAQSNCAHCSCCRATSMQISTHATAVDVLANHLAIHFDWKSIQRCSKAWVLQHCPAKRQQSISTTLEGARAKQMHDFARLSNTVKAVIFIPDPCPLMPQRCSAASCQTLKLTCSSLVLPEQVPCIHRHHDCLQMQQLQRHDLDCLMCPSMHSYLDVRQQDWCT